MRRFTRLPREAQVAYMEGWERSRFSARQLVLMGMRALMTVAYFSHPEVLRGLNLAPKRIETPIVEADLLWPAVGQSPERIPYTREDLTPPSSGVPLDPEAPLDPGYEVQKT